MGWLCDKEMVTKIYKLKTITNLHAGIGDSRYGIVFKLVQKDPISRFPVVNASGIKGSIKEHLKNYLDASKSDEENKQLFEQIFGSYSHPGENKFSSAQLLTYPVRSNIKPFFRATCPAILNQLIKSLRLFGVADTYIKPIESLSSKCFENFHNNPLSDFIIFQGYINNLLIEKCTGQLNVIEYDDSGYLETLFGDIKGFIVVRDDIFIQICNDLPTVARNNLDEKSSNFCYEELVPRQTEFWFIQIFNKTDALAELKRTESRVQIGANLALGWGNCQLEEIFTK